MRLEVHMSWSTLKIRQRAVALMPVLMAGLIAGIDNIASGIAFAAVIFSGELSPYLATGIGIGLFSTIVLGGTIALLSSIRGVISQVQDVPTLLLLLIAHDLVADLPPTAQLPSVLALLATTSILLGSMTFLLGRLRLGNLIRFIPYPVLGGFLAGTGWLLSLSAILMLTNLPQLTTVAELLQPSMMLRWVPGLAFGLLLFGLQRRYGHPLTLPGMILGSLLLFTVTLNLVQVPWTDVEQGGFLLGPFATGTPWQPLPWQVVMTAPWGAIAHQWQQILVLLVVTLMALLLNVTSLEVVLQQDIDFNRELRVIGFANVLSGIGGGLMGYQGLGISTLCKQKLAGHSRWTGAIAALLTLAVLLMGTILIAQIPRFILGGLVFYLGLDFLWDWAWLARKRLPRVDYGIVLVILLTMVWAGVLPAVGLGIAIAIATFLFNYSQTQVVRYHLTGRTLTSHVDRDPQQRQLLLDMGNQIQVLQLQGYLFFGSAQPLLAQVKQIGLAGAELCQQYILLDFHQVTGMDSSAVYSFIKLKQTAPPQLRLVLTNLAPAHRQLLTRMGCLEPADPVYHLEADLEQGLTWCEEKLLETVTWRRKRYIPLPLLLQPRFADAEQVTPFMTYLQKTECPQDAILFEQGASAEQLYFLESGQVATFLVTAGNQRRAFIYQTGTIIGATAFYTHQPYLTTAIAQQPSTIYTLSQVAWQAMVKEQPKAAAIFQEMLLVELSGRLERLNTDLNILLF
jgi:SulP family sulfate permease